MSDAPEEKKSLIGGFAEWCAGSTLVDGAVAAASILLFDSRHDDWLKVGASVLVFVVWVLVAELFKTAKRGEAKKDD